jgi:hypothetical protein
MFIAFNWFFVGGAALFAVQGTSLQSLLGNILLNINPCVTKERNRLL